MVNEGAVLSGYRIYDDDGEVTESEIGYREGSRRKTVRITVVCAAIVLAFFLTLVVGNPGYGVHEIMGALFTHDTSTIIGKYVWNIDVPVMAAALVAGAALSLAGVVMQCILRNPLASPFTLGLSNAAAFGAALSIIFFTDGVVFAGVLGDFITPVVAFLSAMTATCIILVLTKVTRVSSETMILAGIAVSAIFSAGMTLMQYIADPVQLSSIVSWTFGSVSFTSWAWNMLLAGILSLSFVYFYVNRWSMNAIDAGDEVAKGLGVNTSRFLTVGMVISTIVAAAVVSKFGIIAFVGLLGPHMSRMIIGSDHRYLIPMSVLVGALLLLVANTVAQNIILPQVLPVGLLTSLLGGPAFIFLLIRRYGT